jgi:hypothetical protein
VEVDADVAGRHDGGEVGVPGDGFGRCRGHRFRRPTS